MNASIRRFLKEEDGVTALEYGLLAAVVAAAIIGTFGTSLGNFFDDLFAKLKAAAGITA